MKVLIEEHGVLVHAADIHVASLVITQQAEVVAGKDQNDCHIDKRRYCRGDIDNRPDEALVVGLDQVDGPEQTFIRTFFQAESE